MFTEKILVMGRNVKISGTADYIIPLGVVGLGAFLLYKFGVFGDGAGTGSNNQSLEDANAAAVDTTLTQQQTAGEVQTLSDLQLQGAASSIYTMGTADSPDLYGIKNLLMQPQNLTDMTKLIKYFGTKAVGGSLLSFCQLFGYDCNKVDLAGFVQAVFQDNPDMINSINSYYQLQGIEFNF